VILAVLVAVWREWLEEAGAEPASGGTASGGTASGGPDAAFRPSRR